MVHALVGSHEGHRLHKVVPPAALVGQPMGEIGSRYKTVYDALVVAVEHEREGRREYVVNPPADAALGPGEKLIVIAAREPVEP